VENFKENRAPTQIFPILHIGVVDSSGWSSQRFSGIAAGSQTSHEALVTSSLVDATDRAVGDRP